MSSAAVSGTSEPSAGPRSAVPPVAAVAWLAFAALALGQLLVDIDDVVLNIALPSIAADVDMAPADLPWVINAYLLCFGGLLLLGGRLADRWGHRAVLLAGVVVFATSSLLGTFAHSSAAVITARAGQGLAAALLAPAAMSLLVHTFPDPDQRSRALGLWGAVTGLGAVVGLVVGGVVTEHLGWRWIFSGNAVAGIVVGASVLALLPGGTGERSIRIDPLPALLAVTALGSTVSAMHGTLAHGWGSAYTAGWLLVAAASGLGAVLTGRRSSAPLLPGSLLRDRAVVVADLSGALVGAALLGTFYFVSLHLQQVLGYSPLQAGWSYLPLVGGLVIAAGAGSAAVPRFGARPVLVLGLVGCAKGLLLLAWLGIVSEQASFWTSLLPGLLVTGLGLGLAFVALTATAIPAGEGTGGEGTGSGAASGLYNTAVQVGGALGIAVLATVATTRADVLLGRGVSAAQALATGRDLALVVAAGMLLAGALLALLMPASAGRSPRSDSMAT
jgi:EmrB/QacA subfamily drug resistance transporter